jgi:predicted permease
VLNDLRYTVRMLLKNPGFTVVAVLTLALGIGANIAIFSVVYAVLLRPLPYKDPNHLALVVTTDTQDPKAGTLYENFKAWRSQSQTFEDFAVYYRNTGWSRVTLTWSDESELVQGAFVSANFFPLMGISPLIGRMFSPEEERLHEHVVVLSHSLWKQRFESSPDAIGKTLQIDGASAQIIGVMPTSFQFPAREMRFWAPITINRYWLDEPPRDESHIRNFYMRWNVVGRLKPGLTFEAAQAEMSTLARRLEQQDPLNKGLGVTVVPLKIELSGNTRLALFILLGAVSFVLLIACANVANLMLARGTLRNREFSIRAALGAPRIRLIQQMLTESAALAALSGCAGLLLAAFGTRLLVVFGPADIPRLEQARVDSSILVYTLGLSLLVTIVFGLAPAWKTFRNDPNEWLKAGGRSSPEGTGISHAGRALAVSEFAVAVVLLTGAGLLIRSFLTLQAVSAGFQPAHVLTLRVSLPGGTLQARQAAFYPQLLERVQGLPGVHAVGGITGVFEGVPQILGLRVIEGGAPEPRGRWTSLSWTTISGNYFRAMGTPLLRGRFFSEQDSQDSPLVAIVDESLARRYWPGEDPIGKRFKGQDRRGRNDDWITVIGLVSDMRRRGLENEPTPHIFEWYKQAGAFPSDIVVRTTTNPLKLAGTLRAAVRQLDRLAILSTVLTMEQRLDEQLSPRRFQTWLLTLFSLVALLLASVGVYGVMHYCVVQRTHEIGIRMALGAQRGDVLRLIVGQGLRLATTGLVAGLTGAWWVNRILSSLLYGVTPTDPATFAGVSALLAVVALVACYIPAHRATKVDPMVALRHE